MDTSCSYEGQEALPLCLLGSWWTYLCLRWILRQHRIRNQRHNWTVWGREESMGDANCPHEEPTLGLQRSCHLQLRDITYRRKEHKQKWWGPSLQCKYQELEAATSHESAPRIPQVLLLIEQDLRHRWWLRYVMRSVRYQREQMVLHFFIQFVARQLIVFVLVSYCNLWLISGNYFLIQIKL